MIKLLALILLSIPSTLFAQSHAFKIIGHTAFYNNKHLFIQGGAFFEAYNDFEYVKDNTDTSNYVKNAVQVQVVHDQFTIYGNLKYPHPFIITSYDAEKNIAVNSNIFFIDEGTVNIDINDLAIHHNLGDRLNSRSNKEYQYLKKLYSNSVDPLTGAIHDLKGKLRTIQKYVVQNPNSYVALWDMVIDYVINRNYKNNNDLKGLLKNIRLLSPAIKKTNTYQALVKNINKDLELNSGKMFPNILLNSIYQASEIVEDKIFPNIPLNSIDSLLPVIKKNKFTLLDFWFSYCKPCIAQFPQYKKIYDLNKSKGFEIIGISADRKEDEANWQKVIEGSNLDWLQYLDTNELITGALHITSFPTNFLLDSTGRIIKKDISQEDLEVFLQKNLN